MGTYDVYVDGTYGDPQTISRNDDSMFLLSQQVNFALQNLDAGDGDVLRVLDLRPETLVLACWLRVIKAAPTSATVDFGYGSDVNYWGNGLILHTVGIAPSVLTGTFTRSDGNIATGDSETSSLTIAGATVGDTCTLSMDADAIDLMFYAYVKEANSIKIVAQNGVLGARDPDGDYEVFVDKAPRGHDPLLFSSTDTIDLVATTDISDVNITSGIVQVSALCVDLRLA